MEKLAVLASVDPSLLTEGERAVHEEYERELLEITDAMLGVLDAADDEAATLEDVWKKYGALFNREKLLHGLAEAERNALLSLAAREFEFTDEEAEGFKDDSRAISESIEGLLRGGLSIWM